jgi:putative ABC transport system permease protein
MMCFECLLYGSRALLFGLPVSGVISYLIWLSASDGFEYPFTLPWEAMGTSALCVFTVVFVTMLYAMGKIRQANPIDALKNENL